MITAEKRIRSEVERELDSTLSDSAWDYLLDKGYVEDVLIEAETIQWLADEARQVLRAGGRPAGPPPQAAPMRSGRPDRSRNAVRVDAISVLLAGDARERKDAQTFREEVLADGLLSLEEVEDWIMQQAEKDGPHTRWLRVAIPKGHKVSVARGYLVPTPAISVSDDHPAQWAPPEYLTYGVTRDRWTRRIPVAEGEVLGRLYVLSRSLAHRYGWQESQATLFVLTDIPPLVIDLSAWVSFKSPFTSLSRINLTVDPALSPREVAEAYRKIRQGVVGSRFRDLSEKHTRLAVFAAERPEEETWKQRMKAWNEAHPQLKYTVETNFARDCSQAQQRLLTPTYELPIPGAGRKEVDNEQARQ